jgi:hypothetical protein
VIGDCAYKGRVLSCLSLGGLAMCIVLPQGGILRL